MQSAGYASRQAGGHSKTGIIRKTLCPVHPNGGSIPFFLTLGRMSPATPQTEEKVAASKGACGHTMEH